MSRFGGIPVEEEAPVSGSRFGGVLVEEAAPEPELDTLNTIRGGLQKWLQGQGMGSPDEIVGAGRAVLDNILPDPGAQYLEGDDMVPNPGDDLAMYIDDERANMERFDKEYGGVGTALDVAGSFANPLNYVGGGLTKAASVLGTAGKMAARGAAEGAGEGYLRGEGEGRGESALTGGVFGGVLSGLVGGAGKGLTNKWIDEDLVDAATGVQTPIHMAAPESVLGKVYRNVVGNTFGGRGSLRKQEAEYLASRPEIRALVDNPDEIFNPAGGTKYAKKDIAGALDERGTRAVDDARRLKDEAISAAEEAGDLEVSRINAARDASVMNADEVIGQNMDTMRREAALAAVPQHKVGEVLDGVDLSTPHRVSERLNKFWNKDAFREVKDRTFKWDNNLKNRLRGMMEEDAAFKNAVGSELKNVDRLRNKLGTAVDVDSLSPSEFLDALMSGKATGQIVDAKGNPLIKQQFEEIDGDVLMEIRNVFARGSNDSTGISSYGQRQFAKEFDRVIRDQLPKEARDQFDDQLSRYTNYLSYKNASDKATKAGKWGGKFDDKELTRAAANYGNASEGAIPHAEAIDRARAARELGTRNQKAAIPAASQAKSDQATALTNARQAARNKAAADIRAARDAKKESKSILEKATRGALPEEASFWSQLATTGTLGGIASGFGIGALPAGAAIGMGASSKVGQRLAAGQTGLQEAFRNNEELLSSLLRAGSRSAAGAAGER